MIHEITMGLNDIDVKTVDELAQALKIQSKVDVVGTALHISKLIVNALQNGSEVFIKHKNGYYECFTIDILNK